MMNTEISDTKVNSETALYKKKENQKKMMVKESKHVLNKDGKLICQRIII